MNEYNFKHTKRDKFFYPIVRIVSFGIRYFLCYSTIEQIPIFESETAQWVWSAVFGSVIYTVFWAICFPIVGALDRKFCFTSSTAKSICYFILYLPLIAVTFLILKLLTRFGILPISCDTSFNLLEWLLEKFKDFILFFINLFVNLIFSVTEKISEIQ